MTFLGFDRTDHAVPVGVATSTWSQLSVDSSRFFLSFFFFPKLHLAAHKEARSTFILSCQYPMCKLQTSHFHMDRSSRQPAHMKSALLEMTIKMLDITHHPRHFDASLECQMTLCLHLPPRVRRSPWPDFTKARDDNDLIQVNDVT